MNRLQEQLDLKSHSSISKYRRGITLISTEKGKRLEQITGIDRRKFCWPDEFGNPWPEVDAMFKNKKS